MLIQTQPVTVEPVSLAEVKDLVRMDGDHLDLDLTMAITSARSEAERWCGRSFAPQTWMVIRDGWWAGAMPLPYAPIDAIDCIKYLDEDGEWQTLPAEAYTLDSHILFRAVGYKLPRTLGRDHNVRIKFEAGTWPDGIPGDVARAIAMLAQSTFDSLSEQPETLRERAFSLLRPYRWHNGLKAA